ncbi:uncharacterized protein LOC118988532 [Sturnira hondurensis]|uniref:uncharacterized protein LOC118988532 n=1 Tax=Sturnira hondurensis TaxID=192404 RepID=UPI0018796AF1|nr:uncharacterized protein LOC118988532 [Sturnira hondurensis]
MVRATRLPGWTRTSRRPPRGACCSAGRAPRGHRCGVPVGWGARRGPGGAAWRNDTAREGPSPGLRVTGTASGLARSSIRSLPAACSAVALGSAPEEESFRVTRLLPGSSDLASRLSRVHPRELTTRAPNQRLCPGDGHPARFAFRHRGRSARPWLWPWFLEQGTDCTARPRGIRFWRCLRDCPTCLATSQRLSNFSKRAAGRPTEAERLVQRPDVRSVTDFLSQGLPTYSRPEIAWKWCCVLARIVVISLLAPEEPQIYSFHGDVPRIADVPG